MMIEARAANASPFIGSSIVVVSSVRFFDINFDLHLAGALEGQGEREILVSVEWFDEAPQQDVRSIGIELDRGIPPNWYRADLAFTIGLAGAQLGLGCKRRRDRNDAILRRSRVPQYHIDRHVLDAGCGLTRPGMDELETLDLELVRGRHRCDEHRCDNCSYLDNAIHDASLFWRAIAALEGKRHPPEFWSRTRDVACLTGHSLLSSTTRSPAGQRVATGSGLTRS